MSPAPTTNLIRRLQLLGRLGFAPRNAKPSHIVLGDRPDEALMEWTTRPADLRRIIQFRRVLDLGCGAGSRAVFLARQGYVVDAVESSVEALAKARHKALKAGVSVNFHLAEDLRFAPSTPYDLVIDYGCFYLLDRQERSPYLAFLKQHTTRGSRLILRACLPLDRDPVENTFHGLFEAIDRRDANTIAEAGSRPFRLRSYHMYRWE